MKMAPQLSTTMAIGSLVSGLAFTLPASAQAEIQFEPPIGCQPVLTVQQRSCQVMNHWRCGSGDGVENWYGYFTDGGAVDSFEKNGPDHQFIHVQHFSEGGMFMGVTAANDNSSLSALVSTGRDNFDVTFSMNLFGIEFDARFLGETKLSGKQIKVDGETLSELTSSFAMTFLDSDLLGEELNIAGTSTDYLLVADEIFMDGTGVVETSEGTERDDNSPVEIIRPGEDGFFTRIPKYDCGVNSASLNLDILRKIASATRPEEGKQA